MFDVIDNVSLRIQMYDLLCRMPIFIRNLKLADNVFPYILYIFIVRTRMSAR